MLIRQTISWIAELTLDDIQHQQDDSYIRLGQQPVIMPPALARLITAQAEAAASHSGPSPAWLLPGRSPGRPANPAALGLRLRDPGIDIKTARNTALLALAADLPAPALSKITGLPINTAVDWTRHAARDWTVYLAARTEEDQTTNTAGAEYMPCPSNFRSVPGRFMGNGTLSSFCGRSGVAELDRRCRRDPPDPPRPGGCATARLRVRARCEHHRHARTG